jgi:hypothetical protein
MTKDQDTLLRHVPMYVGLASLVALLVNPNAPRVIRQHHEAITAILNEAREHQTQLQSWENEGGAPHMPKAGNSAQKLAARRVQNTLQIRYTHALKLVNEAKVPGRNWGQTADAVIEERSGTGFPEPEGDAE